MPDAAPLEPGDPASLGQYEVVGRLGAGGQGAVYLGRSPSGGHVAIKLLHDQMNADPSARTRFAREVEAAQKVSPFCTAQVLDHDLGGRPPYIISEYIDGPPLFDVVMREGPFTGSALERLAIGTATALAAIHEAGIVHRDFKPNNVLLASDGPRVVDFGIARSVNSQQSSVTATGMVVGTPGYLAPEQLTGVPLTPAVDIFAWGATMVFAATGHSPFEAETLPVIINRILNEEPDLSRLTGMMRELVGAALAKNASARPAAHQLLLRLLGHVGAAHGQAPNREDLLGKGTQIASQLPPPPSMTAGPQTPNLPPLQTPNPPMMGGPRTQPGWQPPPYQPRRRNRAPLFIGLGCAVLLLLAVGVPVVVAAGFLHSASRIPPPPHFGVPDSYVGTWKGVGRNTRAGLDTRPFTVTITLNSGSTIGSADYGRCSGQVFMDQADSTDTKVVFRQSLVNQNGSDCAISSYVTMTLNGSTMDWQMGRTALGGSFAGATLTKQ